MRTPKWICLFLALILCLGSVAGCAAAPAEKAEEPATAENAAVAEEPATAENAADPQAAAQPAAGGKLIVYSALNEDNTIAPCRPVQKGYRH